MRADDRASQGLCMTINSINFGEAILSMPGRSSRTKGQLVDELEEES